MSTLEAVYNCLLFDIVIFVLDDSRLVLLWLVVVLLFGYAPNRHVIFSLLLVFPTSPHYFTTTTTIITTPRMHWNATIIVTTRRPTLNLGLQRAPELATSCLQKPSSLSDP